MGRSEGLSSAVQQMLMLPLWCARPEIAAGQVGRALSRSAV
eukprot:SAG31_NODE_9228_length_1313_cov_0.916804_2_plen_40_part_01